MTGEPAGKCSTWLPYSWSVLAVFTPHGHIKHLFPLQVSLKLIRRNTLGESVHCKHIIYWKHFSFCTYISDTLRLQELACVRVLLMCFIESSHPVPFCFLTSNKFNKMKILKRGKEKLTWWEWLDRNHMSILCCACTPLHLNQTELKVRELLEDRWRRHNHAWEWDITNACQSSSTALLDAHSLTFFIVRDKFQLNTLEAFWIWRIIFSLLLVHVECDTYLPPSSTHEF